MSIRNGGYQKADGTYEQAFFDLINDLEKRVGYAAAHTSLPEKPDDRRIEELVMSVNERVISGAY